MRFAEMILKNLLRRKSRSLLTAAGLAVAIASTTTLLSVAWGYAASAADSYRSRRVDLVVVRAGVTDRMTSSLRAGLAARLDELPEVAEVDGTLTEMVSLGGHSIVGIPMRGIEPQGIAATNLEIATGRMLNGSDRRAVLVGAAIAHSIDKQAGQAVEIEGTSFDIAGIFRTDNAIEANAVVAPLGAVQELMDRPDQVSEFQVRVHPEFADPSHVEALCRRIESLHDDSNQSFGFKALPVREFIRSGTQSRLTAAMAWGTTAIAVVLSLVGMANTMLMSVLERTKELGILRAIGWSRRRVLRMILGESLALGALAAVAGLLAAWALVQGLAVWSFTRGTVQPTLSAAAVATGLAVTLTAAVVGAFYPAYRGATVTPMEALHFE